MPKQRKLPEWISDVGIFLLKSLGWTAIAILTLYFASYYVKFPPNRADIFSLVEVLFGIVITALAIVASFAVSYQWSTLERNIRLFDEKVEKTRKDPDLMLVH